MTESVFRGKQSGSKHQDSIQGERTGKEYSLARWDLMQFYLTATANARPHADVEISPGMKKDNTSIKMLHVCSRPNRVNFTSQIQVSRVTEQSMSMQSQERALFGQREVTFFCRITHSASPRAYVPVSTQNYTDKIWLCRWGGLQPNHSPRGSSRLLIPFVIRRSLLHLCFNISLQSEDLQPGNELKEKTQTSDKEARVWWINIRKWMIYCWKEALNMI